MVSCCSWSRSITSDLCKRRAAQQCWGDLQHLAKLCYSCATHIYIWNRLERLTWTWFLCCGYRSRVVVPHTLCDWRLLSPAALLPYTENHFFSEKNSILSDVSCCQRAAFWALSLQRAIEFWAENSLSHLRRFPFSLKDFLASVWGCCVALLLVTMQVFFHLVGRKSSFIKENWTAYMSCPS